MSTRLCLFGAPPDSNKSSIVGAVRAVFRGSKSPPDFVYVGIQSKSKVKARRWFYLLIDGDYSWTFEGMSAKLAKSFSDLTSILYHDGWGVFKFEHRHTDDDKKRPQLVFGINTVGPFVEVYAGKLQKTYPQSGFTDAQLRALQNKNPDEMSEAECKAVTEYKHAVDIGINELFPEELFPNNERRYIKVGYEKSYVPVVVEGALFNEEVKVSRDELPDGLTNFPDEWDGSIYS